MVGNSHPILIRCHEGYTWIRDFAFAHFVSAVVNVDPPLPSLGAAQLPLVAGVYAFCFGWLEAAAHRVEHLLWRRVQLARRGDRGGVQTKRHGDHIDLQKLPALSSQMDWHFDIPW